MYMLCNTVRCDMPCCFCECDDGWSVVYGYGGKNVNVTGGARHDR